MVLFTKVGRAAALRAAERDLAFRLARHRRAQEPRHVQAARDVTLLPLYTTDEGGSVLVSSDTWPNVGGVLGLTRAQIAEARAAGVQPPGGGGFAYMTRAGQRAGGIRRQLSGRALQPRASVAGGAAVRAALVPEAPERAGARGLRTCAAPRPTARCRAARTAPGRR